MNDSRNGLSCIASVQTVSPSAPVRNTTPSFPVFTAQCGGKSSIQIYDALPSSCSLSSFCWLQASKLMQRIDKRNHTHPNHHNIASPSNGGRAKIRTQSKLRETSPSTALPQSMQMHDQPTVHPHALPSLFNTVLLSPITPTPFLHPV